jgi:glycosyltransferase involved in cell wall biosynthesis
VAAEGLGAKDGRHCLIADDPAGLVAALHSILDDAALASRLATEGRQLVRDGFTWKTVDPRFVAVVERAARLGRAAD